MARNVETVNIGMAGYFFFFGGLWATGRFTFAAAGRTNGLLTGLTNGRLTDLTKLT